ncbi:MULTISPECIES: ABC-type transport auxiliary lipoprotein family protein [unclassified Azospirillum]|uniref:ABC-type transport auxiliary lipoprotein family protein n=1 Tax=unclassified Azospirillum TaxID=2630922 RepID=UPI000B6A7D41|nr:MULTISPECIES: ABC-type transport auxiliary lipoprotein family protein [unclassified Azospirillum]SNS17374.1 cholesterol transport system auxiliary component [Azospirillum sp. RU38E]SNS34700.1 cholesterol transport system auxiliary component [Azospirillum sp. RU37A]
MTRQKAAMQPVSRLNRRALLGLALLAPLAGCSPVRLLNGGRPPRLYLLTPARDFVAGLPRVPWQLLVETPLANSAIDTPRIALGETANRITYFAEANWADTGPDMLQTLLVESFENSRRIVAVGVERSGLRADFVLKTDLRDFQAVYDGGDPTTTAPEARVRVNAKLVRMPRRNIVAGETFEAQVRASSPALNHVVAAFDEATGAVLRRIVEWTLQQGNTNVEIDPLPGSADMRR